MAPVPVPFPSGGTSTARLQVSCGAFSRTFPPRRQFCLSTVGKWWRLCRCPSCLLALLLLSVCPREVAHFLVPVLACATLPDLLVYRAFSCASFVLIFESRLSTLVHHGSLSVLCVVASRPVGSGRSSCGFSGSCRCFTERVVGAARATMAVGGRLRWWRRRWCRC